MSVCRVCRTGADWNRKWRVSGSQYMLSAAIDAHSMCRGCDCQHVVGADSRRVIPDALALAQEA